MKTHRRAFAAALVAGLIALSPVASGSRPAFAAEPPSPADVKNAIDWPTFLARHDIVWTEPAKMWEEGAFLGNGLLGTMIDSPGSDALRWDVGRSDVTDKNNRIAIGGFVLVPVGTRTGAAMRLHLWDAEATGTLTTDKGGIEWRTFTHAHDPVTLIDWGTTSGEGGARIEYRPEPALPARAVYQKTPILPEDRNPDGTDGADGDIHWRKQTFKGGGGYVVAWGETVSTSGRRLLAFTVDYAHGGDPKTDKAVSDIRAALKTGVVKLAESHQQWWHSYWPEGFLSIPDTRMESFYWLQMYKLASGTRADRPALDLMGPWFRTTPWPRIWWNLNIQLTYWPVYTANRLEIGESLTRMIDADRENFIHNVPEEWQSDSASIARTSSYDGKGKGGEYGNLTWALHNYWLQYRYSGDEKMLRDGLYPILKRSVGYLIHLAKPGPDGKLHLPESTSPEYPKKAPDTNYDLSLMRWGLQTLLATNDRLKLNDPLAPKWRETLEKLTPFPVDPATGYEIGAGVPLAQSHRHFSHLFMFYPLHLQDPESATDRPLLIQSLDHWIGFEGALRGYSFTGASAMSSWLRGDRIGKNVSLMNEFLDRFVKPNTMYTEAGPVIETPLAAASSIHEVVLQSWSMDPFGTDIRVFPAVPADWKDVTIDNLRTEGAFLVSASRRNGKTRWVKVTSVAGAPCRIQTSLAEPIAAAGSRKFTVTTAPDADGMRITTIDLKKGETVLLTSAAEPPSADELSIAPVAADPKRVNYYGTVASREAAAKPAKAKR